MANAEIRHSRSSPKTDP